jgi:Uma2 family endonuclease
MHHRVTYAELSAWPDNGRRYELHDGDVREVSSPLPRHQMAVLELQDVLRGYVKTHGGLVLVSPIDVVFDDFNVVQPDILLFTAARRHLVSADQIIRVPPDLVVEVLSRSSAAHDLGRKLETYERFGVSEYWTLDPMGAVVEIRRLVQGQYVVEFRAGRRETFTSPVLPGLSCSVDALLDLPARGPVPHGR